jgi:hypothetical protein
MTVDRLLTEIEDRFGARAADGLQVLTSATLVSRPFDPGLGIVLIADSESDV